MNYRKIVQSNELGIGLKQNLLKSIAFPLPKKEKNLQSLPKIYNALKPF